MPSGGLLVQITMTSAPAGIGLPWIGYGVTPQIIGFTSADNDTTQTLDGTNAIVFQHGVLTTDSVKRSNSLNVSGGKGGLAEALSGSFALWDSTGVAAAAWLAGNLPLQGATVYRAWMNSSGTIYKQDQLILQEVDPSDCKITCKLKSALFVNTPQLYRTRVATQVSVDPYDPQNPTDPNYQLTAPVTQIAQTAGFAFGGRRVTIKSINQLVAQKICFFGLTKYWMGNLSSLNENTPLPISTATLYHKPGTVDQYQNSGSLVSLLAWLDFVMEPDFDLFDYPNGGTDLANLKTRISQFVNAGYRIVASDGTWFVDLNCSGSWTTQSSDFRFENGYTYQISGNLIIGDMTDNKSFERTIMRAIATTINPDNSNGPYNVPPNGLDPTQVSLYAVPSQLTISGNQTNFRGLGLTPLTGVTNTDTATFGLQSTVDGSGGIVVAHTPQSSPDGYMAAAPIINVKLGINPGAIHPGGMLVDGVGYGSSVLINPTFTSLESNGATTTVNQNPNTLGGSPGITFGLTGISSSEPGIWIYMRLEPTGEVGDYDYFQIESSFLAKLQCITGETSGSYNLIFEVQAPGEIYDPYGGGGTITFGVNVAFIGGVPGETHNFSYSKQASALPAIDWNNATKTFSDFATRPGAQIILREYTVPYTGKLNAHFNIRDLILWGFKKLSASNPDVVVWPFPVTDPIVGFADYGSLTQMVGVAGSKFYLITPVDYDLAWNLAADLTSDADGLNTLQGIASLKNNSGHSTGYIGIGGTNDSGMVFLWFFDNTLGSGATAFTKVACPSTFPGTLTFFGADTPTGATGTPTGTAFWFGFSDGSICNFVPSSATAGTWTNLGSSIAGSKVTGMASDGSSAWHFALIDGSIYEWNGSSGSIVAVDTHLESITYDVSTRAFLAAGLSGVWRKTTGAYSLVHSGSFGLPAILANNGAVVLINQFHMIESMDGGVTWNALPDVIGENVYTGIMAFQGASGSSGHLGHTIIFQPGAYALSPTTTDFSRWIPAGLTTPDMIFEWVRQRYLNGANGYNPLQLVSGQEVADSAFGVSFDPPDVDQEGTRVDNALETILSEAWIFAGEGSSDSVNATNDVIELAAPDLIPGDLNDVCTFLTINYQKWAGSYLRQAYIRNVDQAWDPTKPTFFFSGWDADDWNAPANSPYTSTQGYAIWAAFHEAWQKTGILFEKSLNYDTIHDPYYLGSRWASTTVLGNRYNWLCKQPRYLKLVVYGNDSASALANAGCLYQANQTMLVARGLSVPTYGIVTRADHDLGTGIHQFDIAYPPA